MTHAESLSQCASNRNHWRYNFRFIFMAEWKWQYAEKLTYNQFVKQLDKGELKSLKIQPEQNVYMVSGKTDKGEDYSSTILYNNNKELEKLQIQHKTT